MFQLIKSIFINLSVLDMAMSDLLAHVDRKLQPEKQANKIVHPSESERFQLPNYPIRDQVTSPNIPSIHDKQFSVISYNILADCYAHNAGYWYCKNLERTVRHESLMKELSSLNHATILCFQEVTKDYFSFLLQPALSSLGYEGVYQQKDKRHKKSSNSQDGLATFYQKDRCILLATRPVIVNELMVKAWKSKFGNTEMSDSCYKDNVGLLTAFSIEDKIVSIGNVHLYFDWCRPDVQSLQGCMLLHELMVFAKTHKSFGYLYCGDFNSQTCTELYSLLTQGTMSADGKKDFLHPTLSITIKNTQLFKPKTQTVPYYKIFENYYTVSETLKSVYSTIQGSEPLYTNYTGGFHGCLDYIFYSDGIEPISVVALPEEKTMRSEVALPNSVMSSDHLSLKAGFSISNK